MGPGRTEEAEQAWSVLGNHLGFSGQRPEKEVGVGSDVLWSNSDGDHLVIEVKSGATAAQISEKDISQLGGSVRWAQQTLTGVNRIVPVIVHPSHIVDRTGTPPEGTRVVNADMHTKLVTAIRSFATALAVDNQFRDTDVIQQQLVRLHMNGVTLASHYGAYARVQS